MIRDLFTPLEKGKKYTFDEEQIFLHQLNHLKSSHLINDDDYEAIKKKFSKYKSELRFGCTGVEEGIIPFIICPDQNLYDVEDVLDEIIIGGSSQWNTFFLDQKKLKDLSVYPPSSSLFHIVCGIQIGITHNDLFDVEEFPSEIKKASSGTLQKIQNQLGRDIVGLTLYEGMLLSLYYPDIYDIWDGIQTAGTVYGEDEQMLRLYWLNDKANRFLKVAKEKSQLLDSRFISPRIQKRMIIEK